MITRKELIQSKEYWLVQFQAALYVAVDNYLRENKLSRTAFAQQLGVSKGYISQLMNGNFDHKISKLIELSLAIGKAPQLAFEDLDKPNASTGLSKRPYARATERLQAFNEEAGTYRKK